MDSPNPTTQNQNLTTATSTQRSDLRLRKSEKLCSQTAIDALFGPNPAAKGALAYPLRLVYAPRAGSRRPGAASVQFLVSVPKKRLRHAVDRVCMRRRIREAFRLNRDRITADLSTPLDVVFIYVGRDLTSYAKVERAMKKLLAGL